MAPLAAAAWARAEEGPINAQESSHDRFIRRLWMEHQLLMRQRVPIFASLFVLIYGALVLFRNLAFYRYRVGNRLRDVGYELLDEFPPEWMNFTDVPAISLNFVIGGVLLGALVGPDTTGISNAQEKLEEHPHFINIIRRMLCVYAVGHTLRAATYLSTSIPGSSRECIDAERVENTRPQTITECFYRVSSINGNCGDLVFSGHVLFITLILLIVIKYGAAAWSRPQYGRFHCLLISFTGALWAIQVVFTLKARHHYTVDVVVAAYVVPLLWYFYSEEVQPHDLRVDHEALAKECGEYDAKTTLGRALHLAQVSMYLASALFLLLLAAHGNFKWLGG